MIKPIPGYDGLYEVSDTGEVYSLNYEKKIGNKRKLKPFVMKSGGYLAVSLAKDRKQKLFKIHRLVAVAFIKNPKNKPQVNHINGVKTDNRVENLEWATNSENVKHSYDVLKRAPTRAARGKENKRSKALIGIDSKGNVTRFESIGDAARKVGGRIGNISRALNGGAKTSYGYKWLLEQMEGV